MFSKIFCCSFSRKSNSNQFKNAEKESVNRTIIFLDPDNFEYGFNNKPISLLGGSISSLNDTSVARQFSVRAMVDNLDNTHDYFSIHNLQSYRPLNFSRGDIINVIERLQDDILVGYIEYNFTKHADIKSVDIMEEIGYFSKDLVKNVPGAKAATTKNNINQSLVSISTLIS
ncbi:hypothetical protein BB561_003670 [Smittium simulii]|uniref:Uncharacterized protein n=1 Tax=Smittium simulii TaxID=133385 RepID=A0A2T9YK96_9FUNG|nr:hypothetical protein BB561_003670 [Smittium simulii]